MFWLMTHSQGWGNPAGESTVRVNVGEPGRRLYPDRRVPAAKVGQRHNRLWADVEPSDEHFMPYMPSTGPRPSTAWGS